MADPPPLRPPGWPGIPARWTSSAKSGVGTALSGSSRVWFTISHGILNEIYYPDVDVAGTRDLGLVVTGPGGFLSEEKRHASHEIRWLEPGVPAFRLDNRCGEGRYRIEKTVIASPENNAVLQRIRFVAVRGTLTDYQLFALLSPHLGNQGGGNTGWVGDYKGVPMLLAQRDDYALALAASVPWLHRSVGYVGSSDGWQDLMAHGRLSQCYSRAENGNLGMTGELDLQAGEGSLVLSVGFGRDPAKAAHHALTALLTPFDESLEAYCAAWRAWQEAIRPLPKILADRPHLRRQSAAVLRSHQSKSFLGGTIASLSIPWGRDKGDGDLGGYHLVWPRDLAEAAGAMLAIGAHDDALRVLRYLQSTQEADGHWAQNQWLDGTPFWSGVQMDETALPLVLIDLAFREGALDASDRDLLWPMVQRAAAFLVQHGPVTMQDRWEEDPGYAPFTLAAEIAALLVASALADLQHQPAIATYLRETADNWNASIEEWTYVRDTELARRVGVEGYYVRIAPPERSDGPSAPLGFVPIKNRPPGAASAAAEEVISPDALALVRFGLRRADDPRIVNTVKVIDAVTRVELPGGPGWRRYGQDGYGEHEDGSAYDGTGIGRPWPLLVGERAHYAIALGQLEEARRLMETMESFASPGGLLPEQVWDGPTLPELELFPGDPTGSAMPLVWAHAEYLKLLRSLEERRVFDMPPLVTERCCGTEASSPFRIWRFNQKCRRLEPGKNLRIEVLAPARVRWSRDGWHSQEDIATTDSGLGVHLTDLPTRDLPAGSEVTFTFYWVEAGRWEGADFRVTVAARTA